VQATKSTRASSYFVRIIMSSNAFNVNILWVLNTVLVCVVH